MEATRDTTPIVLSGAAATTVTAGVIGPAGSFPSAGLMNLLSDPLELSDLIITTTIRSATAAGGSMAMTNIRLAAGRHGLTNGFVPVPSLGVVLDPAAGSTVALADGTTLWTIVHRWIFPRPLILRPGEGLAGAIELSSFGTYAGITATVNTTITARGRRIPVSAVPRAAPYPFSSGAYYRNTGLNLPPAMLTHQNIFQSPFNVVAIICAYAGLTLGGPEAATGGTVVIYGPAGLSGGPRREVAMSSMMLAFGQRRALEVPCVLMPGESFMIKFPTAPANVGWQPAVSIMGYREENA